MEESICDLNSYHLIHLVELGLEKKREYIVYSSSVVRDVP